jgi:hypothetical protein
MAGYLTGMLTGAIIARTAWVSRQTGNEQDEETLTW